MRISRSLFLSCCILTGSAFAAPNVVLISIDTLRADHLSMYGYQTETMPFVSSMAKKGVVFDRVIVPMPSTTPSHGSMLTGQYPSRHGSTALSVPIHLEAETIAEALGKNGYYTAGAVAVSHIGRAGQFDQGFADFSGPEGAQRNGDAVNLDLFKFVGRWRKTNARKPLFLFAHYFDCHSPYGWWRGEQTNPATLPVPERIARYDESIRHVDQLIANLHAHLRSLGVLDNTIFIVTSDHGEQIGDRGLMAGHADIYGETVYVPLVVFGSGIPTARVAETVSTLDISPSIAGAAGVKLRGPLDGRDILPRRGDPIQAALYKIRGLPDSNRDFLVLGNPWYTRSISLYSRSHVFIRNFDRVYRDVRKEPLEVMSAAERARSKPLPLLTESNGERHYVVPATSYQPFVTTVDVIPAKSGCTGTLKVSMPPGFAYFSADLYSAARTRVQFSGARLDAFRVTLPSTCKSDPLFRLDRPADAPFVSGSPVTARLFSILYAERKQTDRDELYDLDEDPAMLRNLIDEPNMKALRIRLDQRTRELYGLIYSRVDARKNISTLPPEEIEKLKSLGYLF
jgi:arylsulfatase A-like enzyme